MPDSPRTDLLHALRDALIQTSHDEGTRFVVVGEAFLRLRSLGRSRVRIEAPSNELLPRSAWIGVPEVEVLQTRGFALPAGEEAFFTRDVLVDEDGANDLAEELGQVLLEAFGADPARSTELLESPIEVDRPRNVRTARNISVYRDAPDAQAWDELCDALLDAEMMVAVEPNSLGEGEEKPRARPVHDTEGAAAAAAFLGHESARRAAPRGLHHVILRGEELFAWVDDQGLDRLVIDPAGPIPLRFEGELLTKLARSARERVAE